jgi:hypothetical protein
MIVGTCDPMATETAHDHERHPGHPGRLGWLGC